MGNQPWDITTCIDIILNIRPLYLDIIVYNLINVGKLFELSFVRT